MNPTNDEITAALQRLDRALTPAPVLAAKAVAEFRERGQVTPWINVVDTGAPLLQRDAVLRASQPNHAPKVEVKRRRALRLLFWR